MKLFFLLVVIAIVYIATKNKKAGSKGLPQLSDDIKEEKDAEKYPYKKKGYLLSKAENNFYEVLSNVLKDQDIVINCKVRLADLLYIPKGVSSRQSYFNRIQSKHVDFVICKRRLMVPLLAIELDDKSHQRNDRIERDEFLDQALEDAMLPIIRVKASDSYNVNDLRERIMRVINIGTQIDQGVVSKDEVSSEVGNKEVLNK